MRRRLVKYRYIYHRIENWKRCEWHEVAAQRNKSSSSTPFRNNYRSFCISIWRTHQSLIAGKMHERATIWSPDILMIAKPDTLSDQINWSVKWNAWWSIWKTPAERIDIRIHPIKIIYLNAFPIQFIFLMNLSKFKNRLDARGRDKVAGATWVSFTTNTEKYYYKNTAFTMES